MVKNEDFEMTCKTFVKYAEQIVKDNPDEITLEEAYGIMVGVGEIALGRVGTIPNSFKGKD